MFSSIFKKISFIRDKALGLNERNYEFIYKFNPRVYYKYADDKVLTKSILESNNLKCPKTFAVIGRIGDIESIWQELEKNNNLVIKPAKGSGGQGIKLIYKKKDTWFIGDKSVTENQIFSHIANIIFGMHSYGEDDRALIEELIVPHNALTKYYHDGVADIRIILLNNKPHMAMLRLPTKKSEGKANLHQGGLGVGIDLETGELTHVYNGKSFVEKHPDSGITITGNCIPYWEQILELSVKASKVFPLNYLGVDIVIDKIKGPLILEINIRPGLAIQVANKKGLKDTFSHNSR